jgi:hypothetical protein
MHEREISLKERLEPIAANVLLVLVALTEALTIGLVVLWVYLRICLKIMELLTWMMKPRRRRA